MVGIIATPGDVRDPKHVVQDDLKAFLEAFAMLEAGVLSPEILKKIA